MTTTIRTRAGIILSPQKPHTNDQEPALGSLLNHIHNPGPHGETFMNRSLGFHHALLWCAFSCGPFLILQGSLAAEPTTERPLRSNGAASRRLRITDWPRWRGPNADGVADDRNLPIRWTKPENVRWSVTLPGWGTSSPVVYGNR